MLAGEALKDYSAIREPEAKIQATKRRYNTNDIEISAGYAALHVDNT
jgi:hypothetical protein